MLSRNFEYTYKSYYYVIIDKQLFPFRGHTKFTQHVPPKPAKKGTKVFLACDASNAYPLRDQISTGKPTCAFQQVNAGERIVLILVN